MKKNQVNTPVVASDVYGLKPVSVPGLSQPEGLPPLSPVPPKKSETVAVASLLNVKKQPVPGQVPVPPSAGPVVSPAKLHRESFATSATNRFSCGSVRIAPGYAVPGVKVAEPVVSAPSVGVEGVVSATYPNIAKK